MSDREFRDVTEDLKTKIKALRGDPELGPVFSQYSEELKEADRTYALGLARLRQAFELTQATLAERLGTTQGNVAKIEHRSDLLVSTLMNYLRALGGDMKIIASFEGHEVEVALGALEEPAH